MADSTAIRLPTSLQRLASFAMKPRGKRNTNSNTNTEAERQGCPLLLARTLGWGLCPCLFLAPSPVRSSWLARQHISSDTVFI